MFTVRVSEARPIGSMLLRGMGCLVSAVFCIQATANKVQRAELWRLWGQRGRFSTMLAASDAHDEIMGDQSTSLSDCQDCPSRVSSPEPDADGVLVMAATVSLSWQPNEPTGISDASFLSCCLDPSHVNVKFNVTPFPGSSHQHLQVDLNQWQFGLCIRVYSIGNALQNRTSHQRRLGFAPRGRDLLKNEMVRVWYIYGL